MMCMHWSSAVAGAVVCLFVGYVVGLVDAAGMFWRIRAELGHDVDEDQDVGPFGGHWRGDP